MTAVHLIDLDEMRHHHGTFSPEAGKAVRRNEDRLALIRAAMEETPGMEDALLIAVSDHGQSDISRTVNLTEMLNKYGLSGEFSAQSNGESAYFFAVSSRADPGKAMQILQEHLAECGILRLYSRKDLDRMHAVAGPSFACEAADQVVFSDGLDQEKREKQPTASVPDTGRKTASLPFWERASAPAPSFHPCPCATLPRPLPG